MNSAEPFLCIFFFFNDTATTEIYTLSLHDALPIWPTSSSCRGRRWRSGSRRASSGIRSEEHTSELQSLTNLVCRLLLEKTKNKDTPIDRIQQKKKKKTRKKNKHCH